MSRRNLILLLFVFAAFIYQVGCSTYIISSPGKCPLDALCLTLSQFATNVTLLKESEIHLKLSSEIHVLEVQLNVTDITFLRMSPYYYQSEDIFEKPVIMCYLSGEINLDSIAKVIMNSIDFRGCINTKIKSVGELTIHLSTWLGNGTALPRKRHFGTAFTAIKSTLRILNCSLKHFNAYVSIEAEYLHELKAPGAVKCIQCNMEVHNSTFASNNGVYGGAIYAMHSTILLLNSTFINNGKLAESMSYGGELNGNQINLTVIDCAFNGNGQQFFLGGVLNCLQSNIEVRGSCNKAQSGGAFFTRQSKRDPL